MTEGDVPDDDMNENLFPFHRRNDGVPADDAEKLLRGETPAADAAPEVRAVGDVLGALCLPAQPFEVSGEGAAVAAFSASAAVKERALAAAEPRRRSVLSALTGAKLAVAAVTGSLALGGVAAAACTGSLPGPLQDVAHTLGAPGAQNGGGVDLTDLTGTGTASASPSGTKTKPTGDPRRGHGPSAFAVCWFVVHKTDGAAGGPWAGHAGGTGSWNSDDGTTGDGDADDNGSTAQPTASPTGDPSDKWDHGRGEWSAAYAKVQAAAAAKGETVLQLCTDLLASHTAKPHPSPSDKHGKGFGHDGSQGTQGGRGHDGGSGSGHGSGGQGGPGGSGGSGDGGHGGSGGGQGGDGGGSGGSGH